MKIHRRLTVAAATAALAAVPAAALAQGPNSHSANAKKYGKYCQGESKQHVSGQKRTPFSACVTDMAKVAQNSNVTPREACANESKQHVSGQKGTPFSVCVAGAAKLRRSQNSSSGSDTSSS